MITSSIDNVKARRAPPRIPGARIGKVISKNVLNRFAPRSNDASSMELSYPASLALTLNITKGMQKVT